MVTSTPAIDIEIYTLQIEQKFDLLTYKLALRIVFCPLYTEMIATKTYSCAFLNSLKIIINSSKGVTALLVLYHKKISLFSVVFQ